MDKGGKWVHRHKDGATELAELLLHADNKPTQSCLL